MKHHTR